MLADASLTAGFPGCHLRRVQRLREPRQQPQVCGIVLRGVLRQEAAGRPDAPGGLPKVTHQFVENDVFFFLHGPTVHPAHRPVRERPPYGTGASRTSENSPFTRLGA